MSRAPLVTTQPRLMYSELTGRIYVVTKWRIAKDNGDGTGLFEAVQKFDVTEDFAKLATELQRVSAATAQTEETAAHEHASACAWLYDGFDDGPCECRWCCDACPPEESDERA